MTNQDLGNQHDYNIYKLLYTITYYTDIVLIRYYTVITYSIYIYAITTPSVYIIPRTAVRVIIQYPNTYYCIYLLLVCITTYTLHSTYIVRGNCDWWNGLNSMQLGIAELRVFCQPQIIALTSYYGISIFIQTTILLKYAYLENSFLFRI